MKDPEWTVPSDLQQVVNVAEVSQRWRKSSPSELSEVQALRQEMSDMQKKLLSYADTVVSLYNELRTLRENICLTCKERFAPAGMLGAVCSEPPRRILPSCSEVPAPTDPRHGLNGKRLDSSPVLDGTPNCVCSALSNKQTPDLDSKSLESCLSPDPPIPISLNVPDIHIPSSGIEQSLTVSTLPSSSAIVPKTHAIVSRWSVRREGIVDPAFDVSFVRAFVHKDPVQSVKFSSDGKYLAAVLAGGEWQDQNGQTCVYNMEKDEKACVLAEWSSKEKPGIVCAGFSPNGRYLVVGDISGRVTVWDVPNKRIRNIFRGHKRPIESVDCSPNGRFVVSSSWDQTVRIWNMRNGSSRVLTDNSNNFWSVRFSPNGQYVAAGDDDGMLRIWDVRTGRLVENWSGHEGGVRSVAFTLDGTRMVSGSTDGVVKHWDVSSLGAVRSEETVAKMLLEYKAHTNSIYSVAVTPDAERIASASNDKTAVIWGVRSAMQQCTLLGHEDVVLSVDFSPSGNYLALGSRDRHVTLWRYT